jgi:hypothetical protein
MNKFTKDIKVQSQECLHYAPEILEKSMKYFHEQLREHNKPPITILSNLFNNSLGPSAYGRHLVSVYRELSQDTENFYNNTLKKEF